MSTHALVLAMLWENWRLTRNEAAQRLVQGIVLASGVLAGVAAFGSIGNSTARLALSLLVMTYLPLWLSVAKLNGGRFMDGYRPGYPFYFLYARPVRTYVLVAAPMAYNVASVVALYLVSALVLRAAFGYPFPLLPLAALIAAFHAGQWAAQWGTSNKIVQWAGSLVAGLGFTAVGMWSGREWPARFDFPFGAYALTATVAVACFGLAVAGVARQRRGDAGPAIPHAATRGGFSDWLAGRFRFPCPITSATRAQVWFDLKSSGLPVLTIGGALAIVIPLSVVAAVQIDVVLSSLYTRPAGLAGPASLLVAVVAAMFSLPAVLLLSGNAFGIRARQGRMYASAFDATLACRTARMAGLKVLMRSVCLLAALVAVGVSVWASLSFIAVSEGGAPLRHYEPMRSWQRAIAGTAGAMSGYELLALAFVACIGVAVVVALRASLTALRARDPRPLKIAVWSLLLHGLLLIVLTQAARRGIASEAVVAAIIRASQWGVASAIVLATLYVTWRVFAERLLTVRAVCAIALISVAFGIAWVALLRATGVQLGGMPAMDLARTLWPALLPLTASVLAPWSLSRVRHT